MKMGLVFTFGMSLEIWHRQGGVEREKLIYEEFLRQNKFEKIYWFTYGSADKALSYLVHKNIEIVAAPAYFNNRLGMFIYSFLMPFLKSKYFKDTDIIKSNQINGSWTALIACLLYRKKLILRGGYIWSIFAREKYGCIYALFVSMIEGLMCKLANAVVVTSQGQREYLIRRYNIKRNKVFVVSNYVDTDRFKPLGNICKLNNRIVYVGRIDKQKNLINLIASLRDLSIGLDIYGEGDLRDKLASLARDNAVDVRFMGVVPNSSLPEVLNKYSYFILPSFYEGMPKSLLEAMSCGLTVLGTDINGINEIIEHRKNGWLITEVNSENIKGSIDILMRDKELRERLAYQARRYVEDNFSVKKVADTEINIYNIV